MEGVKFSDFEKLELRVGEILKVEEHPNASKLFILKVSFGDEERTIVAGLRGHYTAEELEGKKAVFVTNLEPAVLRGVKSEGMILAASNEGKSEVKILKPKTEVEVGTIVEIKNDKHR